MVGTFGTAVFMAKSTSSFSSFWLTVFFRITNNSFTLSKLTVCQEAQERASSGRKTPELTEQKLVCAREVLPISLRKSEKYVAIERIYLGWVIIWGCEFIMIGSAFSGCHVLTWWRAGIHMTRH